MGLAQFRRRFQVLDPALQKKLDLVSEGLDERKVCAVDRGQEEAGCSPRGHRACSMCMARGADGPGGTPKGAAESSVRFDSDLSPRLHPTNNVLETIPTQNALLKSAWA